jgi:hypothetical protein
MTADDAPGPGENARMLSIKFMGAPGQFSLEIPVIH